MLSPWLHTKAEPSARKGDNHQGRIKYYTGKEKVKEEDEEEKRINYFFAKEKKKVIHWNTHCTVTLHVHVWQVWHLSVSHTIHVQ